jgi:hypothetical protein
MMMTSWIYRTLDASKAAGISRRDKEPEGRKTVMNVG